MMHIAGRTLGTLLLSALACAASLAGPARAADAANDKSSYVTESLRGKVVFTAEALKRLHGIEADDDTARDSVSLETSDGHLHPIVKDARGRGFLLDQRLRKRDMELLVRRYEGSPFVQVIRVYTFKDGQKHELDYWCDICAIPMYELKECECCQGPIRIRERPVED
jgi:hypothetical protein